MLLLCLLVWSCDIKNSVDMIDYINWFLNVQPTLYTLVVVLVCWGCHMKYHMLGNLYIAEIYFSQFWGLDSWYLGYIHGVSKKWTWLSDFDFAMVRWGPSFKLQMSEGARELFGISFTRTKQSRSLGLHPHDVSTQSPAY